MDNNSPKWGRRLTLAVPHSPVLRARLVPHSLFRSLNANVNIMSVRQNTSLQAAARLRLRHIRELSEHVAAGPLSISCCDAGPAHNLARRTRLGSVFRRRGDGGKPRREAYELIRRAQRALPNIVPRPGVSMRITKLVRMRPMQKSPQQQLPLIGAEPKIGVRRGVFNLLAGESRNRAVPGMTLPTVVVVDVTLKGTTTRRGENITEMDRDAEGSGKSLVHTFQEAGEENEATEISGWEENQQN